MVRLSGDVILLVFVGAQGEPGEGDRHQHWRSNDNRGNDRAYAHQAHCRPAYWSTAAKSCRFNP
jgi:hypothetical protein